MVRWFKDVVWARILCPAYYYDRRFPPSHHSLRPCFKWSRATGDEAEKSEDEKGWGDVELHEFFLIRRVRMFSVTWCFCPISTCFIGLQIVFKQGRLWFLKAGKDSISRRFEKVPTSYWAWFRNRTFHKANQMYIYIYIEFRSQGTPYIVTRGFIFTWTAVRMHLKYVEMSTIVVHDNM